MINLALTYAHYGVAIFPCREQAGSKGGEKAPYIHGGWHRASCNEHQIREWWNKWPKAVVGLPCALNGIIALDADRHGLEDGVATLLALFSSHELVPSSFPCVTTPRNGLHILFQRPKQMLGTLGKIAPAVDVRDKAYIIGAGSRMANSCCYSLQTGTPEHLASAIGRNVLPILPNQLATMLTKPLRPPPPPRAVMDRDWHKDQANDTRHRLLGLIRVVAQATPGERNDKLFWAACRASELVRCGRISEAAAMSALSIAGTHIGLTPHEIAATVRSGMSVTSMCGSFYGR